ncbi:hypothetical protein WJX74_005530 [Apatococcus lobatus]|uniref:Uncharacterized protein n=1 Tax=Apatococcus lobatus TaxID=904363 RepID=A0AAW1RSB2_9CHLO
MEHSGTAVGKELVPVETSWQITAKHPTHQAGETSPVQRLKLAVRSRNAQPVQLSAVALECRQQSQWKQAIEVLEHRAEAAEKRSDDLARANKRLRAQSEKAEKDAHLAQGKAETLAGCLAAADAKRKTAEENLKRLEIRMGQGRQGMALLKAAKMQTQLDASHQHSSDLASRVAHLTDQVAHAEAGQAELQEALSRVATQQGLPGYQPLLELSKAQQELQQLLQSNQTLERQLKVSKQQAAIVDEEVRAGLPLRSQLQEVSGRVLELEAQQRQADEDRSDLLDYIQELEAAREAGSRASEAEPQAQAANPPDERLQTLEAEAAELRREKGQSETRFHDCKGQLEAAQEQLRHALATQEAAQTHLAKLQKDMLHLQRTAKSDRLASASPAKTRQPAIDKLDTSDVQKLREDRDTAASQLALLAARTEDLLRENRSLRQQMQPTKMVQPSPSSVDERCTQLQEQVVAATGQVGKMTSHNERLLEQVRQLEQKALEAELALEEQHEASNVLLQGNTDDQDSCEALSQQIEMLSSEVVRLQKAKIQLQHRAVNSNEQETETSVMRSDKARLVTQLKTLDQEQHAGPSAADAGQKQISHPQEDLQAQQLQFLHNKQHSAQQSVRQMQAELNTERADKAILMDGLSELQKRHEALLQETDQVKLQLNRQSALDNSLASSKSAHDADTARLASADQQLHAQADLLKELQTKLQIQQDEANELQLEKASAEERFTQLVLKHDMLKEEQHGSELERQAMDQNYQALSCRCAELEDEATHMNQLKAQLVLATESEDAAHNTLMHLEQEREALSSQLQELQLINTQLLEELSTASEQHRLELQQLDSKNATLREQLQTLQHEDETARSARSRQVQLLEQQLKQSQGETVALKGQYEALLQKHADRVDQAVAASELHQHQLTVLQEELTIRQQKLHSQEAELAAVHVQLDQWKLACNEQEHVCADRQKQVDKQQAVSDDRVQELARQLKQSASHSDELMTKLQASYDEQAQLSADLKQASEACMSLRQELDQTSRLLASEQSHSNAVEEEALEASRKCATLQAEIHGLREAKLEAEYASASHVHAMEQEVSRLGAELTTAQEAGSGLLASQQQLLAELDKAAKYKLHAEEAERRALHLQDQVRLDSGRAQELQGHVQSQQSRSEQLREQLEDECSKSGQLQQQLEAAHAETTRLSAALDSIQAASLASQPSRAVQQHEVDADAGASTPSSEERRVMQVAQISEMSLKLHEAEVQNLQHQIQLQQDEISRLQNALQDQADLLQCQQEECQSRARALQQDLNDQIRLVQQHQHDSSWAQEASDQLEAQHQADVGQLQLEIKSLRSEAKNTHAEALVLRADEKTAWHARENAMTEIQDKLHAAERDVASLQRERNSLLHQLAASKRDEGRLQRLQQQCAALEEENAALSDSLASQAKALTTEALEDAAGSFATLPAQHDARKADDSSAQQAMESTSKHTETGLAEAAASEVSASSGRGQRTRSFSAGSATASEANSTRSDGTLHEKLHGLQANFKQMRMRYQAGTSAAQAQ